MTKQRMDAAFREQIAQWVREALGEQVEDENSASAVAAQIVMRYSTRRGVCCRLSGFRVRKEGWIHAYPCSRGRTAPGVFVAPCPVGRAPYGRSRARW